MTLIDRTVRRVSLSAYRFGSRPRRIVAQLGPGDVLVMREQGRRYTVALPLDWCYRQGVKARVDAERAERRRRRRGGDPP